MTEKPKRTVLIVDDEQPLCAELAERFRSQGQQPTSPYEFEVDTAATAFECISRFRAGGTESVGRAYDVVVLDVRMERETSGVEASLLLHQQLGWETPVRIIFTGWPCYEDCVQAMRYGAWDYIVKEDVGETPGMQLVVNSAISRLQQLDLQRDQEQQIGADWIPEHFHELQSRYGGQLVALWSQLGRVGVLACGGDAFELEADLEDWRRQHPAWMQPFIVHIPTPRRKSGEES